MASAQPSQDMWRGRDRRPQTLGNAQPRPRTESRRLSDRLRPVKTATRQRDNCPGALHSGDQVHVFSRSAAAWVDGEVVSIVEGSFVRVEYKVGEYLFGKTLHLLHCEDLAIPTGVVDFSIDQPSPRAPSAAIETVPFLAKGSSWRGCERQPQEECNPWTSCSDPKPPSPELVQSSEGMVVKPAPMGTASPPSLPPFEAPPPAKKADARAEEPDGKTRHSSPKPPPCVEPVSDPRWLLSCKYDGNRHLSKNAHSVESMLGSDVVSNPNHFSKTCCTIVGEEWDDNYNKGENAEKYSRCWDPTAPQEMWCTKPVGSGQEPTTATCWKSSYFWRLQKSRKMLRLVELRSNGGRQLGEGQKIEKAMAEFLQGEPGGCEVRVIHCEDFEDDEDFHFKNRVMPLIAYPELKAYLPKGTAMEHANNDSYDSQEEAVNDRNNRQLAEQLYRAGFTVRDEWRNWLELDSESWWDSDSWWESE